MNEKQIERVRRICMGLPETTEKLSHGEPTFFVHNKVYGAKMGGYFVETCDDILASDNVIRDNGSRGVTKRRLSNR